MKQDTKRDWLIVGLTTVAVLIGFLIHSSYSYITSADDATQEGIDRGKAAMERFHEATREAERERQKKTDAML